MAAQSLSVSVVAQKLGYGAEASFSRAFKRIIGALPSQFRKGSGAETNSFPMD